MRRARRFGARSLWDLHFGPNMTPMVDVVMVILVFFMASAAVLGPEWFLRSSLPVVRPAPAPSAEPPRETRLEISLVRQGGVTLVRTADSPDSPLSELLEVLAAGRARDSAAELSVLLYPDPDVPYQDLVTAHEACQRAGVAKVGMLDRPPTPK
jgi:biopolymer transport protein ExbD